MKMSSFNKLNIKTGKSGMESPCVAGSCQLVSLEEIESGARGEGSTVLASIPFLIYAAAERKKREQNSKHLHANFIIFPT